MTSRSDPPLAADVFTQARLTALIRALSGDNDARITEVESAPATGNNARNRYERVRVRWEGTRGEEERRFLLKVLPDITWSEALRPLLPTSSEILLVESDLSAALSEIVDDTVVAAGRRTEQRPAWILSEDESCLPVMQAPLEQQPLILRKSAALHALHWQALPVLDDLYPWLPRFEEWVRIHCRFLVGLLDGDVAPTPYARRILGIWPDLPEQFAAFWNTVPEGRYSSLWSLLEDPAPLLAPLAATPHSILHGNWRSDEMCVDGERLIVREWQYVQVGPAAWDLCTYLSDWEYGREPFDPSEAITTYLDHVATIIPELSPLDRARFRHAYDLSRVLDLLLHPRRWERLRTIRPDGGIEEWLNGLVSFVEQVRGREVPPA